MTSTAATSHARCWRILLRLKIEQLYKHFALDRVDDAVNVAVAAAAIPPATAITTRISLRSRVSVPCPFFVSRPEESDP